MAGLAITLLFHMLLVLLAQDVSHAEMLKLAVLIRLAQMETRAKVLYSVVLT